VAVEKVGFAEIRLKMGDQKCIRSRRESFIGLPRATVFQRNFRERLFQQLHRPSSRRNGLVEKWRRLFAELKNQIGLRRLRLRRMRFVREQFYLAATVQNLKRLVRLLSLKPTEAAAVTA